MLVKCCLRLRRTVAKLKAKQAVAQNTGNTATVITPTSLVFQEQGIN